MNDKLDKPENSISDHNDEAKNHRRNWQWKSNELKKALDDWQHLTEEVHGPSPDEQVLQDMQKLIKEIQAKLNQFTEK
jgi:TATA-binding protein-associated factor Taf7